jgi:hypothetical protein
MRENNYNPNRHLEGLKARTGGVRAIGEILNSKIGQFMYDSKNIKGRRKCGEVNENNSTRLIEFERQKEIENKFYEKIR